MIVLTVQAFQIQKKNCSLLAFCNWLAHSFLLSNLQGWPQWLLTVFRILLLLSLSFCWQWFC